MFYYFYDTFLNNKKYEKVLAKIEARITDLGIDGKKRRLNILENIKELVEEAIERGAETIVAVGNDETFTQLVNIVANSNITLGYIPLAKPNKIAKDLGIPFRELACDALSSRLVETVDLGKVNQSYFFSSLKIIKGPVVLKSGKYQIIPSENQEVNIRNFSSITRCKLSELIHVTVRAFLRGASRIYADSNAEKRGKNYFVIDKISDPKDGILEAVIFSPLNFFSRYLTSLFPVRKLKINSQLGREPIPVIVDRSRILKTPLLVEVLPQRLKVIVGRERRF